MKKLIAFLLTVTVPSAWGGIYIYGTRVIYPEQ
ncbi:TPA: fimbrial assembly protein, partial [Escherichia coli]